jgi:hypothetical protein
MKRKNSSLKNEKCILTIGNKSMDANAITSSIIIATYDEYNSLLISANPELIADFTYRIYQRL